MAIPRGTGDSELIGGDTSGAPAGDGPQSAAFPGWTDGATAGGAPLVCKFLRSIGADGKLSDPGTDAVPTHRCAAFGDPLPLSLRQQELVCLQRVHVSCPRYMRGTLLAEETAAAAVAAAPRTGMPYLTIAGLGLVAVAGVAAIAGMLGLLPGSSANHSPAASFVAAASTTATPSSAPTLTLNPTSTASVAPTATPLGPTASPTTAPTATPVPSATWPPGATASRMKLLTACPGQTNCYIYVVRGPGPSGNGSSVADTVKGIATFFGVNLNTVYSMNPGSSSGVHPGDKLKIPSPTR